MGCRLLGLDDTPSRRSLGCRDYVMYVRFVLEPAIMEYKSVPPQEAAAKPTRSSRDEAPPPACVIISLGPIWLVVFHTLTSSKQPRTGRVSYGCPPSGSGRSDGGGAALVMRFSKCGQVACLSDMTGSASLSPGGKLQHAGQGKTQHAMHGKELLYKADVKVPSSCLIPPSGLLPSSILFVLLPPHLGSRPLCACWLS